jgi:anti-sigma regulatory factor (Ser/Thr protein kinase)
VSPLHLDLPHGPPSVGFARDEVRTFVSGLWPDAALADLIDDVRLVVSELVTNAVRHGVPPVTLDVDAVDDDGRRRVVVVCRDAGPWDGTAPSPVGGRGLQLVRALATDVRIEGGATSTVVVAALER